MATFARNDKNIYEMKPDKPSSMEAALGHLSTRLQGLIKERVSQRLPIERRWAASMRQMRGKYSPEEEAQMADRSKAYPNLTGPRALRVAARIIDVLSSSGAQDWKLKPKRSVERALASMDEKPVSALTGGTHPDPETGEEQIVADVASRMNEEADQAARGMELQLQEYLTACNWPAEKRKCIPDMVFLGTAVVRGPVEVGKTDYRWESIEGGEDWERERVPAEGITPSAVRINPWLFFPDLSVSELKDCEDMFELQLLTKGKAQRLRESEGVIKEQLDKALAIEPRMYRSEGTFQTLVSEISGVTATPTPRYELWIYNGPIKARDLEEMAELLETQDDKAAKAFRELSEDEDRTEHPAIVWLLNDVVIKLDLNPLDSGEWLYEVATWEEDSTCIFGRSLPESAADSQSICGAAWRLIMDHAALSSIPIIVYDPTYLKPADQNDVLFPMKTFYTTQPGMDVSKLITSVRLDANLDQLVGIWREAMALMDQETRSANIDTLEPGVLPKQTAHGMSMLTQALNVHVRYGCRRFDDGITFPLITKFRDFEMQFGQRSEIKGDFIVRPIGATVLVQRELTGETLLGLLDRKDDPMLGPMIKTDQVFRGAIEAHNIDPEMVLYDEATLERMARAQAAEQAAAPPPEDTQVQVARIRSETQLELQRMRNAAAQARVESEEDIARIRLQGELARLASQEELTLEEVKADLQKIVIQDAAQRRAMAEERAIKEEFGTGV